MLKSSHDLTFLLPPQFKWNELCQLVFVIMSCYCLYRWQLVCGDNSIDWCHLGVPNFDIDKLILCVMSTQYLEHILIHDRDSTMAFTLCLFNKDPSNHSVKIFVDMHRNFKRILHFEPLFLTRRSRKRLLCIHQRINDKIEGPSCHPMQLPALDQDSRNTGTAVWIFDIFSLAAWVAGPGIV